MFLIWLIIKFRDKLHLQIIEQVHLLLWDLENISLWIMHQFITLR